MYRTLWFLAKYAEIPLILLSILGAFIWLGIWLSVPTGFVVGRLLYLSLKLSFNRLMLGSAWAAAQTEMKRLDGEKVTISASGRVMLRTTANGRMTGLCLAIAAVVAGAIWEIFFLMWLGALLVGMIFAIGYFSTMPPAVLYLGTSSPDSLLLLRNLKLAIFPLRSISLLDLGTLQEKKDLSIEARLEMFDCVRVNELVNWRDAVKRLAEVTPIIVLDAREDSAYVSQEVELLRRKKLALKTFLVTGDDGRAAAAEEVLSSLDPAERPPWISWSAGALLSNLSKICHGPKQFKNLQEFRMAYEDSG